MRRWFLPATYPTIMLLLMIAAVSVMLAWLSFNLLSVAMANIDFLRRHGATAVVEGGLVQLALISLKGFAALLSYLLFRGIEGELLRRWIGRD